MEPVASAARASEFAPPHPPETAVAVEPCDEWITPEARGAFAREIESIGGAEVYGIATVNAAGAIESVEPYAFGNRRAVPAILQYARPGDVVVHNHPSGNLEPSDADINVSSELGGRGIGSYIVNNAVTERRIVVKALPPPTQKKLDLDALERLLQPGGRVAERMEGFEPRPPQLAMLRAVGEAFNRGGLAAIEAGTGTGKSLAYLLPALEWARRNEEKVVIATGTINLQEQLIHKDLPLVARATGWKFDAALLKGRNNYICRRKADYVKRHPDMLDAGEKAGQLEEIQAWIPTTQDGSREALPFTPDDDVWERVMSEADNCLRTRCPFYQQCFFYTARRRAARAQVLVINHHLLMADLAVRAESNNYSATAVLPPFHRLIVDEAHHLEEVATQYFGARTSRGALRWALRRLMHPRTGEGALHHLAQKIHEGLYALAPQRRDELLLTLGRDLPLLHADLRTAVDEAAQQVALALENASPRAGAGRVSNVQAAHSVHSAQEIKRRLCDTELASEPWQSSLVEPLRQVVAASRPYFEGLRAVGQALRPFLEEGGPEVATPIMELHSALGKVETAVKNLLRFLGDGEGRCRWVELRRRGPKNHPGARQADVAFCIAPLAVAPEMREKVLRRFATVVMTSATLAVERNLDYFLRQVGADDPARLELIGAPAGNAGVSPASAVASDADVSAQSPNSELGTRNSKPKSPIPNPQSPIRNLQTLVLDTPFDFERQVYLAVPMDLPDPTDAGFDRALAEFLRPALEITRGRAMVLFTAYSLLQRVFDALAPGLEARGYPCLRQGQTGRSMLTEAFRKGVGSVLFATASFWEGVDIPGEALSCLVLTRLPFGVPGEPIVEARVEALRARGLDPFHHLIVPQAVIRFRQGFGRLIRSKTDRGAVLICDRRVATKSYGQMFLRSLPTTHVRYARHDEVHRDLGEFFHE
jgi:ATP-dependent DNA helicase DinG